MRLHTLKGYIQHIYLVEDNGKLLLLDGCSRADVSTVCNFIEEELELPLSALKIIVVTHMHPDHAGGAHRLRRLTGAKIASHPKAASWYAGVAGRTAHIIDVGLTYYVAGRLGRPKRHIWYSPILRPDIILQDEQSLPGFSDWVVLFTPGHTDHDLSLYHRPGEQLYVADLLVKVKGKLVPPYPLCHPNQYRRSLQRVAQMKVTTLLCAHVKPFNPKDLSFEDIIAQSPGLPSNHWYAVKRRVARKLAWLS